MRRFSIRWRIALWNALAFAIVLIGFGILVYSLLRNTHYDQLDRSLLSRFEEISSFPAAIDEPAPEAWLRPIQGRSDLAAGVLDQQGDLVASVGVAGDARELFPSSANMHRDGMRPVREAARVFDNVEAQAFGRLRRLTATLVTEQGQYTVVLLAQLEHLDEELTLVMQTLLLTIPVTLLIATGLAYLLAVNALAPVQQLRRLADEISADQLDRRLPISNPHDELGLLAHTINSMIARLERSFDEIRRFTADASHELRTPIAVIRSEAELGLDSVEPHSRAASRLQSILEECNRLTSATGQLLALSRDDAGVSTDRLETVHVDALIREVVETMRPLWESRRQGVDASRVDSQAAVEADVEQLKQVIQNLIENAIKYSSEGGRIFVAADRRHDELLIEVKDQGMGIAEEHLPHVFDRFYRVSKDNSSEAGGAGLGLSIVRSIVKKFHGRVEVTSVLGEGSCFRVYWPVTP